MCVRVRVCVYVYIKRNFLNFFLIFLPRKIVCRTLSFLILQRTRLKAENKLYSQDFGVKSWIFFIIGISIVYVKIKLYTKFDAKMLIRLKVMID